MPPCIDQAEPAPVLVGQQRWEPIEVSIKTSSGNLPAVLFVPVDVTASALAVVIGGGSIGGERYDWLGSFLASHGYAAIIPQRRGAAVQPDWPAAAVAAVTDGAHADRVDAERVALVGHSYGGLFGLCYIPGNGCPLPQPPAAPELPEFAGVLTLMSHAQPPNDPTWREPLVIGDQLLVMVRAMRDGRATPEEVTATFDRIEGAGQQALVSLDGVNHYQAADCLDPAEDTYQADHPAEVTHEVALERTVRAVSAFFAELTGDQDALDTLADDDRGIHVRRP